MVPLHIGTAGWSLPRAQSAEFPGKGSHLERYATQFNAAEINTSFYRPHRRSTYERWAASVPTDFRFAVKMPKSVTHERRLVGCDDLLQRFHDEVTGLGSRLGSLLVQLPPTLAFSSDCQRFFDGMRDRFGGSIVCEPRHRSWFSADVDAVLADRRIGRVAADPAIVPEAGRPGGWQGIAYFRLHGSPVIYRSTYDEPALAAWRRAIAPYAKTGNAWMIFDNTIAGAAIVNALQMRRQ